MNMRITEGRADAAPTLNSVVHAWYVDEGVDNMEEHEGDKRKGVHFDETVRFRYISAQGNFRKTPSREKMYRKFVTIPARRHTGDDGDEVNVDDIETYGQEVMQQTMNEGQAVGEQIRSTVNISSPESVIKPRWADLEDSDEEEAHSTCEHPQVPCRPISSLDIAVDDQANEHVMLVNDINDFLVVGPRARVEHPRTERWPGRSGVASGKMRAGHRQSGGYLEGDRPVPSTRGRNQFVRHCLCKRRSRPSVLDIGRRRSVECRCRIHDIARAHVQAYMCTSFDSYVHALPCFPARTNDERTQCFSHCVRLKPIKILLQNDCLAQRAYALATHLTW